MIKKYPEFKKLKEYPNLGNWIESLCEDDEFIRSIVGELTGEVDPKIRVSNAVDVLDNSKKLELVNRVESYLNGGGSQPDISTSVDVGGVMESYGKGVFTTFLKCLTALGLKNNSPQEEPPNNFIVYFIFEKLDRFKVESVFSRFKSLNSTGIESSSSFEISIYFGIKDDLILEYGWKDGDKEYPIGNFKLNKSKLNWVKTSDLKSLSGLKKFLANLNIDDLLLISRLKSHISQFKIQNKQPNPPIIVERTIIFKWWGVGKWDNGFMEESEVDRIREIIRSHLVQFKWKEKILISLTAESFWVYLKIKLK